MRRIFSSKGIVTLIAMIACIVIIFFAYKYRVEKEINAISVPYALRDIPARSEITEDMIGTVKVASSMITKTVIQNKNDILGKYVNYNTYIPAGSLFYSTSIVNWENMPDSAWRNIYTDYTIFSLPVGVLTTYGNSIFPGDKIDLYYQTSDNGKYVIGKLIEGIEVLAVKDGSGNHIFKKSDKQQNATALIFSVPEDLHLLLRKAILVSGSGSLIPVARNANYNPETNVSSEYLKNLIESRCREVPLDVIEEDNIETDNNVKIENNNTNNTEVDSE
jgi:Flp pilus assembly protein CpaB